MREKNPDWQPPSNREGDCVSGYESRSAMLSKAGIENYALTNEKGHWIVINAAKNAK